MNKAQELKKVSVIIPTYNREHFIAKAICSVIEQGYGNIEILVVDDHSNDHTEAVVRRLIKDYPCIMYLKNIRRKGPSGARNTGLLKSSGEYIAFLDSDDIWLHNHLLSGIEILTEYPQLSLLFGNHEFVNYKTHQHLFNSFERKYVLHSLQCVECTPQIRVVNDNLFTALVRENFFQVGTLICRRHALHDVLFDEDVMFSEDRDFGIKLYKESHALFAYRTNPTVRVYRHDNNITQFGDVNDSLGVCKAHLLLFTSYLKKYNLSGCEKLIVSKSIQDALLELSYLCRKSSCHIEGFRYVLRSFRFGISSRQLKEMVKNLTERLYFQYKAKTGL